MKTKSQWSQEFGTVREVIGGVENVNTRITQDMIKRIQRDAMEESASIVANSGLIGEAVKKIYWRINNL